MYFSSQKDFLLALFLVIPMVMVFYIIFGRIAKISPWLIILSSGIIVSSMTFLLSKGYMVTEDKIECKSLLKNKTYYIDIKDIKQICPLKNKKVGSFFSMNKLIIKLKDNNKVIITPNNVNVFLEIISQLNTDINIFT